MQDNNTYNKYVEDTMNMVWDGITKPKEDEHIQHLNDVFQSIIMGEHGEPITDPDDKAYLRRLFLDQFGLSSKDVISDDEGNEYVVVDTSEIEHSEYSGGLEKVYLPAELRI